MPNNGKEKDFIAILLSKLLTKFRYLVRDTAPGHVFHMLSSLFSRCSCLKINSIS